MEVLLQLPHEYREFWWQAGAAALAPEPALASLETMLKSPRARQSALLHRARGDALEALGRTAAALEAYEEALRMGNEHGYDTEGEEIVRRMVALDAAATQAFLERMPADPQQLRAAGYPRVAAAQGRPEALLSLLVRLAEQGQDEALAELGALVGAPWRERLVRAAREEPGDADVQGTLGRMLARLGHHAEARAAFDQALRHAPSSPDLEVRRALLR
jgi:predicted RNA polymerase sigma factor